MDIAARSYAQVRRSALAELAECLGDARLEWLRGRERNILRQRCEFFDLLGQRDNLGVVFPPAGRLPHLFPKGYQNIALQ
jgi:hypothetical protein